MQSRNSIVNLILLSSFIFGCSTIQTVSPIYLHTDDSKSITLFLYDGRIINYLTGEYKVVTEDSSSYIIGTGTFTNPKKHLVENHFGKIFFTEIKEMKIVKPAPQWQTTSLTVLGICAVSIIILILTFDFPSF